MPREEFSHTEYELLRLFRAEGTLTYERIRQSLGVGQKQAYRLLRGLEDKGVPVPAVPKVRPKAFQIPEAYQPVAIRQIDFTEEEALALTVASGAAQAVLGATPLAEPLRRAFGRLLGRLRSHFDYADLGEQEGRWYIRAIAQTRIDPEVFTTLVAGMNECRSLLIDYGRAGELPDVRKVDPLCIAVLDRAVVLSAWCHRARDYRHFSLARIREATCCDPAHDVRAHFDRPDDFDPEVFYRPDDHGALTEGELETFRVLVEPEAAHLFHEREYWDFQVIEEERADGRLVVSWEGRGFEEWRSRFQSWGTKFTVLDPPALRQRMRAEAEALARRYRAMDEARPDMEMSDSAGGRA